MTRCRLWSSLRSRKRYANQRSNESTVELYQTSTRLWYYQSRKSWAHSEIVANVSSPTLILQHWNKLYKSSPSLPSQIKRSHKIRKVSILTMCHPKACCSEISIVCCFKYKNPPTPDPNPNFKKSQNPQEIEIKDSCDPPQSSSHALSAPNDPSLGAWSTAASDLPKRTGQNGSGQKAKQVKRFFGPLSRCIFAVGITTRLQWWCVCQVFLDVLVPLQTEVPSPFHKWNNQWPQLQRHSLNLIVCFSGLS